MRGELLEQAKKLGLRVTVDNSNESVGKKIRAAEVMKVPYTVVIGEKEITSGEVVPRTRKDMVVQEGDRSIGIEQFLKTVANEARAAFRKPHCNSMEPEAGFRERVEALVAQIPRGRVMTYGQLAALCGNARAARIVGGIAHFGDPDLPWQRVVNKQAAWQAAIRVVGGTQAGAGSGGCCGVRRLSSGRGGTPVVATPKLSPLLVIVGETASGKSTLALRLAQQFNGEIICADSWTVRREVNIGTAKPTAASRP